MLCLLSINQTGNFFVSCVACIGHYITLVTYPLLRKALLAHVFVAGCLFWKDLDLHISTTWLQVVKIFKTQNKKYIYYSKYSTP